MDPRRREPDPVTLSLIFQDGVAPGRSGVLFCLSYLEAHRIRTILWAIDEIRKSSQWWKDLSTAQREECLALVSNLEEDYEMIRKTQGRTNKNFHGVLSSRRKKVAS